MSSRTLFCAVVSPNWPKEREGPTVAVDGVLARRKRDVVRAGAAAPFPDGIANEFQAVERAVREMQLASATFPGGFPCRFGDLDGHGRHLRDDALPPPAMDGSNRSRLASQPHGHVFWPNPGNSDAIGRYVRARTVSCRSRERQVIKTDAGAGSPVASSQTIAALEVASEDAVEADPARATMQGNAKPARCVSSPRDDCDWLLVGRVVAALLITKPRRTRRTRLQSHGAS